MQSAAAPRVSLNCSLRCHALQQKGRVVLTLLIPLALNQRRTQEILETAIWPLPGSSEIRACSCNCPIEKKKSVRFMWSREVRVELSCRTFLPLRDGAVGWCFRNNTLVSCLCGPFLGCPVLRPQQSCIRGHCFMTSTGIRTRMAPVWCQAVHTVAFRSLRCHFVMCNKSLKPQPATCQKSWEPAGHLLPLLTAGCLVTAC